MKIKAFLITILLVLIDLGCFAQVENPCGGDGDPDDPTSCPLDTWVLLLVALALVFATIHLYRRQKAQMTV